MPKVDLESVEKVQRTGYPPPHDEQVRGRWAQRLAPVFKLTDFGANAIVRFDPKSERAPLA